MQSELCECTGRWCGSIVLSAALQVALHTVLAFVAKFWSSRHGNSSTPFSVLWKNNHYSINLALHPVIPRMKVSCLNRNCINQMLPNWDRYWDWKYSEQATKSLLNSVRVPSMKLFEDFTRKTHGKWKTFSLNQIFETFIHFESHKSAHFDKYILYLKLGIF